MSYRAGIGASLAARANELPREPHIVCDGCGATHPIATKSSFAPKWFLNYRPPPGWRGLRMHNGMRRWDLCPACWKGES